MTANAPMIAVRALAKRYGGVVALDEMNLEVRRGDIHAIVGDTDTAARYTGTVFPLEQTSGDRKLC